LEDKDMKKIEYQRPEIEVTKLNLEHLLNISGNVNGNTEIGFDGPGNDGDVPSAKGFWDDEEDY